MRGRWEHTKTKTLYPTRYHTTPELESGTPHDGWSYSGGVWKHSGGAIEIGGETASHGGWNWIASSSTPLVISTPKPSPSVLPPTPIVPPVGEIPAGTGVSSTTVKQAPLAAAVVPVSLPEIVERVKSNKLLLGVVVVVLVWFVLRRK